MQKRKVVTLLLIAVFLVSCIPETTSTKVQSTKTKAPTTTATLKVTPTNEAKQLPICRLENYKDCVIPYQDLLNGNYLKWLNTIPTESFDSSKLNTIQCAGSSNGIMFFGGPNTDNFSNPETSRLRRGLTYGITTLKPGELGNTFAADENYLVLPVYVYSQTKDSGVWIPLIFPIAKSMTESQVQEFIQRWQKSGNLMVIAVKNFSALPSNPEDPLVANSFNLIPDMQSRLDDFRFSCDPSQLSIPGVVLETSATQ